MVLGFSALVNVLMLTGSIYMLQVYDRVLTSGSVETLLGLFMIVVVVFAFLGFFDFTRTRLLSRGALRLDQGTGAEAMGLWIKAGLPNAGDASSKQSLRDLARVRGFLSSQAMSAFFDVPFTPLYLGVLFLIHPWLGALTIFGAGVTAAIAVGTRALTQRSTRLAAGLDATERDFADCGPVSYTHLTLPTKA